METQQLLVICSANKDSIKHLLYQVRVIAESDPERMMSDTVAWQAHQRDEETVNIQKPLFNIPGFTATQVQGYTWCIISFTCMFLKKR